jgi:hypothetical protein
MHGSMNWFGVLALVSAVAAPTAGQIVLETTDADQTWRLMGNLFNFTIALAPHFDVDGDGIQDVLVSSPTVTDAGFCEYGEVWVFSSVDGDVISSAQQQCNWFLGHDVASLDDFDGDGIADYAVGAPDTDRVDVILSASPARIHNYLEDEESGIGWDIVDAGDLDLDGIRDYAISTIDYLGVGAVYLMSGATGSIIRRLDGDQDGDRIGWAMANVGDLNDDGLPDLAVGAPVWFGTTARPGYVRVFSGADGAILRTIRPGAPGVRDLFGYSVAAIGDVNGDGLTDLIVGADRTPLTSGGQGRVYIVSAADGLILRMHDGDAADIEFGRAVGAVGDLDGDGTGDYAIRRRVGNPHLPQVLVRSGRTGAELRRIDPGPDVLPGASAWWQGDMDHVDADADGDDDMLIGSAAAAETSSEIRGAVYVFLTPPPCPGDALVDGMVDFGDLNLVLSDFNEPGASLQADVDVDGVVDFADLNLILGAWGSCPD